LRRVLIYVEGRTEERFVRQLLSPYLVVGGVFPIATVAVTKRISAGPDFKGGITSYRQVRQDILDLLGDPSVAMVTTMIDYYGLPSSFPGMDSLPEGTCYERVAHLEEEFKKDVAHPRFRPYLQLHEFEAMVFADPAEAARAFPGAEKEAELVSIRSQFDSPEEIDDGQTTAPSKRLQALFPEYQKAFHGPLITSRTGLAKIRSECEHFSQWLTLLERASPI